MRLALRLAGVLLSLSTLALGGCASEEGEPNTPPSPVEPPSEPPPVADPPAPLSWASCSISDPYGRTVSADCASVDMPARRSDPASGTTPVAIYRLKSKRQPAAAQMWLLNGGPGGAGYQLAQYGAMLTSLAMGVDAYLIDHRGTGESAFLECPRALMTATSAVDYSVACSAEIREAYGPRVEGFSATESANDVKDLIALTAAPGQKVFVYGGSYGSYLAHRLLQLPDVRIDAMITDGNCISEFCKFDTPQPLGVDEPMKFLLEACKQTPECVARLGQDPWAFAAATLAKVAGGHCSATRLAAHAPADLALGIGVYWPQGLLPMLYRLDRCSASDVTVLDTLEKKLEEMSGGMLVKSLPYLGPTPKPSAEKEYSTTLGIHVIASEMVSKPAPSVSELQAKAAAVTFKPSEGALDLAYLDAWQPYPRDALVDGWATRDVPWLMMQGTFDFQTPFSLAEHALPRIEDPSVQMVRIDGGGHGVVFDSRCALSMLEAFLTNPRAKVDASCVSEVTAAALAPNDRYTDYFFGTTNAWD